MSFICCYIGNNHNKHNDCTVTKQYLYVHIILLLNIVTIILNYNNCCSSLLACFAGCIDQMYDAFINIYRYALLNYLLKIIVDRLFTIEIIEFLSLDSIPKKP